METVKALQAAQVQTPHGVDVRKLLDNEHVQVMMITLNPGEALKRHITPVDVFFYALEGVGVAEIGDEHITLGADELLFSPARIPHRLRNEGSAPFRVLVVKTPRPTEGTKLL